MYEASVGNAVGAIIGRGLRVYVRQAGFLVGQAHWGAVLHTAMLILWIELWLFTSAQSEDSLIKETRHAIKNTISQIKKRWSRFLG